MKKRENTYILSIESSSATCGVAISNDNAILADYSIYVSNQHDRMLAELTRRILNDLDVKIEELSAVAVSAGPGSFTGLRIGAAFAKGLCYNNMPKLISVPTLSAFAYSSLDIARLSDSNRIIATVPSHKDLLYYQIFDLNFNALDEIKTSTNKDLSSIIEDSDFICGKLNFDLDKGKMLTNSLNHSPRIIAKYANKLFSEEIFDDPEQFKPLYVQEFVPKYSK